MSSKFIKIVEKYKERFKLNAKDFKEFLITRVEISEANVTEIINLINSQHKHGFNEQQLIRYMHMIAAIQKGVRIAEVSKEELENYQKISFLGKVQKVQKIEAFEKSHEQKPRQEEHKTIPHKKQEIEDDHKISKKERLKTIEEKTGEYSVSDQPPEEKIHKQETNQQERNQPQIVEGKPQDIDEVTVIDFDKTGQDFLNPVIKFQIRYKQYTTWRRYSQFEKLMAYLQRKYQGIVLPQLPPKEGIKGGINYLWGTGVDTVFLNDRRQRLEVWLNRILKCNFVCQDQFLNKFITDNNFQMPEINASSSYMKTISGYTDIVLNYSQLKDYGMAYYNYLTEYKTKEINTPVTTKYSEIEKLIEVITQTNSHRKAMNENFNKRRQILYNYSEKVRPICKTQLDIVLENAEMECIEINKEYNKYMQLKMKQSWLEELIKRKKNSSGTVLGSIQEDFDITIERLQKMEDNLLKSFEAFEASKNKMMSSLQNLMIKWRTEAHP